MNIKIQICIWTKHNKKISPLRNDYFWNILIFKYKEVNFGPGQNSIHISKATNCSNWLIELIHVFLLCLLNTSTTLYYSCFQFQVVPNRNTFIPLSYELSVQTWSLHVMCELHLLYWALSGYTLLAQEGNCWISGYELLLFPSLVKWKLVQFNSAFCIKTIAGIAL